MWIQENLEESGGQRYLGSEWHNEDQSSLPVTFLRTKLRLFSSLFVKDLEQTSKQLHERIDEKRYELHQTREKVTELEDLLVKLDQHLFQEKDRFIQIQNDAYQAQVKNQELRTELRNSMKKRSKCQN